MKHRHRSSLKTLRRCLGCLSLLCLLAPDVTVATDRVLSLAQLIWMAIEHSPELKQANDTLAIAQSDLEQARAAQWPQLEVTATGGLIDNAKQPVVVVASQPEADGSLHGTIEEDKSAEGYGPFGKLEFTITQPLYTFGKLSHRQEAARDVVAAQQVGQEKSRGEVILKIHTLYFALLLAQQGKQTANDVEAFIADTRQRVKRLLEVGSPNVDEGDLYRLEAYAAETQRLRAQAEARRTLTYFALKQLIGLPPQEDFVLDVHELPTDTRALGEQQDYIARALERRPELAQLDETLAARHHLVKAAEADQYPSFFATVIGSFAGAPGRAKQEFVSDDFNHSRVGVVLGAKWHFDLGILRGKVHKAEAEYEQLLHAKDAAELNIPIEVVQAYQEAAENLQAFQALDKAVVAARKWIVVAFSNFDIGLGQGRDILQAVERYGKI